MYNSYMVYLKVINKYYEIFRFKYVFTEKVIYRLSRSYIIFVLFNI